MGFIKRSFYSIIRNPLRSIVIFLIVFSMGSVVAASIVTQQTSAKLVNNIESRLTYSADLKTNDNLKQLSPELFDSPFYNQDLVDKIGKYEGVSSYDYSMHMGVSIPYVGSRPILVDAYFGGAYRPDIFDIYGTDKGNIAGFQSGLLMMQKGRSFTEEELSSGAMVIIIPENIAIFNHIEVGDVIQVRNVFYQKDMTSLVDGTVVVDPNSAYIKTQDLEVIGIYGVSEGNAGNTFGLIEDYTRFYTSNETIRKIDRLGRDFFYEIEKMIGSEILTINEGMDQNFTYEFDFDYANRRPTSFDWNYETNNSYVTHYDFISATVGYETAETTYFLNPTIDIGGFQDYVNQQTEGRLIATSDYNMFQSILSPVRLVSMIASFTKFLSIMALIFVLTLVIQMFVNQRRHEIGVYMAIGEKKYRVVLQIFYETLCVSIIGLLLSIHTGTWLAQRTSSQLVSSQLNEYRILKWVDSPATAPETVIENVKNNFTVEVSDEYLFEYFVIGLCVVSVSSVLPVLYMLKLKPKEILL